MATTAKGNMSSREITMLARTRFNATDTPLDVERTLRTIFKRCVQCPPETPTCPTCPGDQICVLVPQGCHTCAHMNCITNPNPAPTSSGPNVGAIAGGVVGGVAFVAFVVFLVYWFWIKKRREEQDAELEEEWQQDDIASQKRTTRFTSIHDAASTRTRGSLANSILSRASNIIQIAYIPGVTNRNGSGRNSIHAPVPPIPAAHRTGSQPPKSPLSHEGDALFFRPGDLRDSTWSGTSSIASRNRDTQYTNNRDTRYTMASISPSLMRDSVATDSVFWDDATAQPMPVSTAAHPGAARMVSVKSSNSSEASGSAHTSITPEEEGKVKMLQVMMPGQGSGLSPNPSVKSSSSSTFAKPKQVTVGGAKGRFPIRQASDASASSSNKHTPNVSSPLAEQEEQPVETEEHRARQSLIKNIDFATPPAVQPLDSPFFDASEAPPSGSRSGASSPKPNPYASMAKTVSTSTDSPAKRGSRSMNRLSAVVEEQKRASQDVSDSEDRRDLSPFSDEHATE